MSYGIKFKVWGDYACFTRPELKVERVSYDILTPSAARGILEAIYWKPAIKWHIRRIHVLNPIEFTNIRRNEVSEVISTNQALSAISGGKPLFIEATENRHQRAAIVLKNVAYIIEADFTLTEDAGNEDTVEKHYNIILRRLRGGKYFHHPCLGTREFPASFEIIEEGDEIPKSMLSGEKDFGFMLHDIGYSISDDGKKQYVSPKYFRAKTMNGILDLNVVEVVE